MNVPNTNQEQPPGTPETLDRLIDAWSKMGSIWGISKSTAAVHAVLLTAQQPMTLDQIADRLSISRGNTCMCLKELRNWEVVEKQTLPGDRKDYFMASNDMWSMFTSIARQRKRREFDPAANAVRDLLAELDPTPSKRTTKRKQQEASPEANLRQRLKEMDAFLTGLDGLSNLLLDMPVTPTILNKLSSFFAAAKRGKTRES